MTLDLSAAQCYNKNVIQLQRSFYMKMNLWKKTGCMVLVSLLLLMLTACGRLKKEDVVGTYELVSMSTDDNSVNTQTIERLRQLGFVSTLEMKEDGTAEMNVYSKKMTLTYDLHQMVFRMEGDEGSFTYEDGRITFTQGGNIMIFQKTEPTVSASDMK